MSREHNQFTPEHEEVIEYRVKELETKFMTFQSDLTTIKETVLRWDAKFGDDNVFLKAPVHQAESISQLRKDVDDHNDKIDSLFVFRWKAAGVILVIVLLLQIFGGTIANALFPGKTTVTLPTPKSEYFHPSSATHANGYVNKGP